jgi:hypothetical protein
MNIQILPIGAAQGDGPNISTASETAAPALPLADAPLRGAMPKNKRGGARKGAGRKQVLTDVQRMRLGVAIQRRLCRKSYAIFRQSLYADLLEDYIPQQWAKLWAIPPADRARVAALPRDDPKGLDALLSDIRTDIEKGVLQGRRYFHAPRMAANGIRAPIICSVAKAASRRWRIEVTDRMAEKCLKEFRRIIARVDADLADDQPDV